MTQDKIEEVIQPSKRPKKVLIPGILVLLIGIVYTAVQVSSVLSNTSAIIKLTDDSINISSKELLQEVRSYAYILISLLGFILLMKSKRWGWILSFSFLLYMVVVGAALLYLPIQMGMYDPEVYAGFVFVFIMLLAAMVFPVKDVRTHYKIGPAQWLALLIVSGILAASLFLS